MNAISRLHSLQARVVAIVLAIAAAGLVLLAGITYAEQRSFLYDRVDRQVREAAPTIERAVRLQAAGLTFEAPPGSQPPRDGGSGDDPRPDMTLPGRGPGGPPVNLPPGTFGELRSASGEVVGSASISYGDESHDKPRLPKQIRLGEIVTTQSSRDGGPEFRVAAFRSRDGSSLVIVGVPLHEARQTLGWLLRVEAVVIGAVLLLLGVVSWLLIGVGLRPLARMAETADGIAGGDISSRVEPDDERSEIGRLGRALNAMLGRLEQAFAQREASEQRLRQFLADASHELRTPLTSIRGYAELFRLGATSDPAESARAIGRIESEADRMGVLVDSMLQLARLDEISEPVREPVDLSAIARNAVSDARAIAPDRQIALSAPGPQIVNGDPHQLQQVVVNLAANALAHTPTGTPIDVTVTSDDGDVRLDLRDYGEGLPPGDTAQLFGRFWRAETGRKRGKAGAGLGLAIVAEIVGAHGGRVKAVNQPDGGAIFTVWLPRAKPLEH